MCLPQPVASCLRSRLKPHRCRPKSPFLAAVLLEPAYGGEAVWLEMGNGGCRTADNLIEGPNDVNFYMRASKEEDPQLLGQPLRSWALGIQSARWSFTRRRPALFFSSALVDIICRRSQLPVRKTKAK